MAKVAELRDLGDPELLERLESNKEELFNLRFQLATGQLDNPMRIKDVRHDVARMLTILRERELELAIAEAPSASEQRPTSSSGEAEVDQGEPEGAEAVAPEGGIGRRRRFRKEEER
jgi:large subunit ribosomal protein L29